ncbi:MAG: transposase [Oscillospiraceae bacterium]|nr:transposase [Oscillospiraceae bacterium]
MCDVDTELPVAYSVTAANADEREEMIKLLNSPILSDKERREIAKYLLLDRGYDSVDMINEIKKAGICPIVDIRNMWKDKEETRQYKDTDIVYNY